MKGKKLFKREQEVPKNGESLQRGGENPTQGNPNTQTHKRQNHKG